jgi:hypothetical protein
MHFPTVGQQKARVALRHSNTLFRFLSVELNARGDGSLYVSFDKAGKSQEAYSWDSENPDIRSDGSDNPRGFRISYHTSGMINPHGLSGSAAYSDPLFSIRAVTPLALISIPSADRLDEFDGGGNVEAIIDVPNNRRLDFGLSVAPFDGVPTTALCAITWDGLFSVVVEQAVLPPHHVKPGLADAFIYLRPFIGLYHTQTMAKDEAFIRFHQTITGHPDIIIYGPNGEGAYLMVFAVPMRTIPLATIIPEMPGCTAFISKATNHSLRYQIRGPRNELVRTPVQVSVTLDARL